ncbi:hypothetical protein [Mesorhizobium silamurunense]|uniref:hypothetical protein n=1 Tax=Mesorhizobium silamurunense TaxID=499528 RepID=UPI001782C062|nr:hypothetical protein [Mesorhizobium silamurunense]
MTTKYQAYAKGASITRDTPRAAALAYFEMEPTRRKCDDVAAGTVDGHFAATSALMTARRIHLCRLLLHRLDFRRSGGNAENRDLIFFMEGICASRNTRFDSGFFKALARQSSFTPSEAEAIASGLRSQ